MDPEGLKSLYFGGFYWHREPVLLVVTMAFLCCVVGDLMLAVSLPHLLRQAKKTAKGVKIFADVSGDLLDLQKEYADEYDRIFSVKNDVDCAFKELQHQLQDVIGNCTVDQVEDVRRAADEVWNATEAWFEKVESDLLNCTSSAERTSRSRLLAARFETTVRRCKKSAATVARTSRGRHQQVRRGKNQQERRAAERRVSPSQARTRGRSGSRTSATGPWPCSAGRFVAWAPRWGGRNGTSTT